MAMQFRNKSKKKGTSLRLTGLFKTKRRGLFVGSADELEPIKTKLKEALAAEKGLVFFLWRNEDAEEGGPAFTISMDVSQDQDRPKGKSYGKPKRKPVEDDEDTEEESDDDSEDSDNVPF